MNDGRSRQPVLEFLGAEEKRGLWNLVNISGPPNQFPQKFYQHSTRNFLTFVNTTAIAYGQKIARSLMILVLCNSSRVYKRQKITSSYVCRISGKKFCAPFNAILGEAHSLIRKGEILPVLVASNRFSKETMSHSALVEEKRQFSADLIGVLSRNAFNITRNCPTFVKTTAIAYKQKTSRASRFWYHARTVAFTNIRQFRVPYPSTRIGNQLPVLR